MADPSKLLPPGLYIGSLDVSLAVSMNYHELGPEAGKTAIAVARETHVAPVRTVMRWTSACFVPLWGMTIAACIATGWNVVVVVVLLPSVTAATALVARRALAQITAAKAKAPERGSSDE